MNKEGYKNQGKNIRLCGWWVTNLCCSELGIAQSQLGLIPLTLSSPNLSRQTSRSPLGCPFRGPSSKTMDCLQRAPPFLYQPARIFGCFPPGFTFILFTFKASSANALENEFNGQLTNYIIFRTFLYDVKSNLQWKRSPYSAISYFCMYRSKLNKAKGGDPNERR